LNDLCGLKPKKELDGQSLVPLLHDPKIPRERPALTTWRRNNHSLRFRHWRYVRYSDGTEELYDHRKDPMEWNNLLNQPGYEKIKEKLAQWLPKVNAPDAPFFDRKKH